MSNLNQICLHGRNYINLIFVSGNNLKQVVRLRSPMKPFEVRLSCHSYKVTFGDICIFKMPLISNKVLNHDSRVCSKYLRDKYTATLWFEPF